MISIDDLNPKHHLLTHQQEQNLSTLASLVTVLEDEFRKFPGSFIFTINSGFRSIEDQYRIYRAKGVDNPPMLSKHLSGQACDISDPIGLLTHWVQNDGLKHLERLDLYCEEPFYTSKPTRWLHIQDGPPKSKSRFFKP